MKERVIAIEVIVSQKNLLGSFVAEQALNVLFQICQGQNRTLRFCILNDGKEIRFLFEGHESAIGLLSEHLYAHYEHIQILPIKGGISFDEFVFAIVGQSSFSPIKTYTNYIHKTEKTIIDPLASLTAGVKSSGQTQSCIIIDFYALSDKRWKTKFLQSILTHPIPRFIKKYSLFGSFFVRFLFKWLGQLLLFFFPKDDKDDKKGDKGQGKFTTYGWGTQITCGIQNKNLISKLDTITQSLNIFSNDESSAFVIKKLVNIIPKKFPYPVLLNSSELAGFVHMPTSYVTTEGVRWSTSKLLSPPTNLPANLPCIIGKTLFRGDAVPFGIHIEDRRRHVYIVGKTGMGKSTLLEQMVSNDLLSGHGIAVIDPHGDLIDHLLEKIPKNRTNDVILIDPSDEDYPIGINMLENVLGKEKSLVASGLLGIFKKLFADSWGPRLEYILRNTILTLMEIPQSTLLSIPQILTDKEFREKQISKITDPLLKRFWLKEFGNMNPHQVSEAISPILNKVGQFLSIPILRNIFGQPKNAFSFRWAMDKKKIILVNLSKGKIGEDASAMLGSLIITKFQIDAMTRANIGEADRSDFFLYVDEFQNFATDSFATILSEARKYRLNLVLANQYIAQMSDAVKNAIFGNVGTTISFQVGYDDAKIISVVMGETVVEVEDLANLPKYSAYIRLLINGMPSLPFSMQTIPQQENDPSLQTRENLIKVSRSKYGKDKKIVEEYITKLIDKGY